MPVLSTVPPARIFLALHVLAVCLGCGESAEIKRYAIQGEVTFNGQTIPGGTIEFEPDSEQGNRGPQSKMMFRDSQFSIDARRGVVGGPYIVRIEGYTAPLDGDGGPGSTTPKPLFPEYVTTIELPTTRSTHKFDVPAN